MGNPNKVSILTKFSPYRCLVRVFDAENFRKNGNWRYTLRKIFCALFVITLIGSMSIVLTLMVWNLLEIDADAKTLVVAMPLMMSLTQVFVTLLVLIRENGAIAETTERIQSLVNRRSTELTESRQIYEQAEWNHALFTGIVERMMIGILGVLTLVPPNFPLSYAIFGYPPPQLWTPALQIHSFMGQATYVGFFVDWLIESTAIFGCVLTIIASTSIYFGMFCYINAMVKDVQNRLTSSEELSDSVKSWPIYVREIVFHIEIVGAAKSLYLMMDIILFFVALDCSVVIACDLLVFEITNTIDADTIVVFFDIFLTLFMAFSYFYLSEWITTDLLEIGDHFYDSPWYRLPVKQQRLLMLPILRTERVFRLKGLGIFDCSLAVFSAIIRTAGSYFVMIRGFK